jgi:histone-lysine N-methyltransferase SETMAR
VQQLVMQDRHITLRMLSVELTVSKDTIRAIMCDDLEKKKMCPKFVPHLLAPEQKTLRIESCGNFVEMVEKDENMLSKIVTGDETWCFMYDPMTKWQSCEWVSPKKLKPSKVRIEELRVKTMFVFFDAQGVIHREFVPEDQTVNGQFCLGVMEWLVKQIRRIHPKFQNSKEWFLLHDNAPTHTAGVVACFLVRKQVTVLHHPFCLPDLAPVDFFLFPKLKSQLKGKRFQDISTIQANVTQQIRSIPKDPFKKSFQSLYEHCKSCIDQQGDC